MIREHLPHVTFMGSKCSVTLEVVIFLLAQKSLMLKAWCAILGFSQQHNEDGVIRSDHGVAPRAHGEGFWVMRWVMMMMMAIIMLLQIMKALMIMIMMTREAQTC